MELQIPLAGHMHKLMNKIHINFWLLMAYKLSQETACRIAQ